MDYPRCPSCQHELYDRSHGTCPFCGHKLPSGTVRTSTGYGSQSVRKTKLILIAIMLSLLAAGIAAFIASGQIETEKETKQTMMDVNSPSAEFLSWSCEDRTVAG
ncbi:MAG: hypothetical protein JXA64_10110 [Candidatus Fermentibacteraceae bacterium]|nr:hypothetical protein [Candidatus Fermentibacteraceae bacterium]MBN2609454.1 hypothetical protein [Candidatus Fermentibacteraceae bacterium]